MEDSPMMRRWLRIDDTVDHVADFRRDWMPHIGADPELFVALRDDYVNVYYKGNSLAKIVFRERGFKYTAVIHSSFLDLIELPEDVRVEQKRWSRSAREGVSKDGYRSVPLNRDHIGAVFTPRGLAGAKQHIATLRSKEIEIEQEIIVASAPNSKVIVLDRQVADHEGGGAGPRMDFLVIEQVAHRRYRPVFVELKLPNNNELWAPKRDVPNVPAVITQLRSYVEHMKAPVSLGTSALSFGEVYARCYERQYVQKRELGCLPGSLPSEVEIDHEAARFILLLAEDTHTTRSGDTLAQRRACTLADALAGLGVETAFRRRGESISQVLGTLR